MKKVIKKNNKEKVITVDKLDLDKNYITFVKMGKIFRLIELPENFVKNEDRFCFIEMNSKKMRMYFSSSSLEGTVLMALEANRNVYAIDKYEYMDLLDSYEFY